MCLKQHLVDAERILPLIIELVDYNNKQSQKGDK